MEGETSTGGKAEVEVVEVDYNHRRDDLVAAGLGFATGGFFSFFPGANMSGAILSGIFGGTFGGLYSIRGGAGDYKRFLRNVIAGATFSLFSNGAVSLGYYPGLENTLTPFQTENDRGVLVERNNRTQIPYVFNEDGSVLVPFDRVKRRELSDLYEERNVLYDSQLEALESRQQATYDSIKPKKEDEQR